VIGRVWLAGLALAVFSWLPPTVDCKGRPLNDLAFYEVETLTITFTGWITTELGPMPEYDKLFQAITVFEPSLTRPDPAVGGVVAVLDVEAFDYAGNGSAACSP